MPSAIEVGGLTYPVALDTDRNDVAGAEGLCDTRRTHIWIHGGLSAQRTRLTLLHEVLHAALYGDALTAGDSPLLNAEYEERVVSTLAVALFDILNRNPDLVAYVTDRTAA